MTSKEMRRLSRSDLLEMLIDQSREQRRLEKKLKAAEEELRQRNIDIDNAGSIAEAALSLNHIFEAAQASCDQYLENVRLLNSSSEEACRRREEEAEQLLKDTKARCEMMEAETRERCTQMLIRAKEETEAYWNDLCRRFEERYSKNEGVGELLTIALLKKEQEEKYEAQKQLEKKNRRSKARNR